MACAICKTRREKRHCPGIEGDICAICCGEQREETIDCPLDCEFLTIAHHQEVREKKDPAGMPNRDVQISRDFLSKNVELVVALQHALLASALHHKAIDNDVKEALDGLTRTYRTLGSGLYYESRPVNPMASGVYDGIQQAVARMRETEDQRAVHKITDSQIHTVLVFLQQMEYTFNNGRKRGRCFLDNLRTAMAGIPQPQPPDAASLIVS